MTIDWTTVISTFTGAFLAAGTGYIFEIFREKNKLNNLKIILKTAISDDLKHSIPLYEKVSEDWAKTTTVWFATLNEIKESRFSYQNNKDWIHVFSNIEFRRKIFRYYLQSSEAINTLEYQQRRKYEIERILNSNIRDIKLKNESVSHDEALKEALASMKGESQEYDNLIQIMPQSVSKLLTFKTEAQQLLDAFDKEK